MEDPIILYIIIALNACCNLAFWVFAYFRDKDMYYSEKEKSIFYQKSLSLFELEIFELKKRIGVLEKIHGGKDAQVD